MGKKWGKCTKSKAALIAAGDFEFEMVRMYEIYFENKIMGEVQVFRELESAINWLGEYQDYPEMNA